jgi:alpha-glucosidase (family GH31 glycosyl hydrolase)
MACTAARRAWTVPATASRYGHYWTGDLQCTHAETQEQIRGMQVAGLGGFPLADIDAGGFHGGPDSGMISDAFFHQ